MIEEEEVVLEITPSPVRRWMAILALGLLGILMIKLAFEEMPDPWRLIFVLLGAGILWAAYQLRLATMDGLVLTRAGLRTISGRTLACVDNVARVDRGALAFRPSNGFMVRLKRPGAAGWAPGLWWQIGRRLGVGGTLSGGQAKAMADLLADMVAQREEQGTDRD
ncbi:MAG: hypothetical protein F4145_10330 [Boseongicola sp. SB0675_bin_26]|nr:hypothetical protein [Boseongicola sp. SB0675_bin_26]